VQNTLKTCLKFGKFQHPSKKEAWYMQRMCVYHTVMLKQ
jgi:hypothetical protein